uniref:(northern house mosquito) hypothetical protein n=1 Tax=Culex pipiens TaxID=7175 RepID=A0A8D8MTP4_CULPI
MDWPKLDSIRTSLEEIHDRLVQLYYTRQRKSIVVITSHSSAILASIVNRSFNAGAEESDNFPRNIIGGYYSTHTTLGFCFERGKYLQHYGRELVRSNSSAITLLEI